MPGRALPTLLLTVYLFGTMGGSPVWLVLSAGALLWAVRKRSPFLALALPIAATYLQLLLRR
ncbi:MAG: hypothetical protein AB7Q16_18870 [Vicinamibacterales bacterium]